MNMQNKILKLVKSAKEAAGRLAGVSTKNKNRALIAMAESLLKNTDYIMSENKKDIAYAEKKGLSKALIDRLTLNEKRINEMCASLKDVAKLDDPVGRILKQWKRPNGLVIKKKRVPIGVIAIIYESRPNVTVDSASLCLKSGNACILRGGSEAIYSNRAILKIITKDLTKFGIPVSVISMIDTIDRKAVEILLKQNEYIDLVIPRGGEDLMRTVAELSLIPVIKHYKGVCHLYVDKYADFKMAIDIAINAKTERPGVCNAIEKLLVHKGIAQKFLPLVARELQARGVELRGCPETVKILKNIKRAAEKDWHEEYLDLILTVKVVKDVHEAVAHINIYGSRHSDAIVTKDKHNAEFFLKNVDAACVYHNASTRFTDGYQFGMGAEIGISTDKIHARGPMALEELCTYKYVVVGNGQVRE